MRLANVVNDLIRLWKNLPKTGKIPFWGSTKNKYESLDRIKGLSSKAWNLACKFTHKKKPSRNLTSSISVSSKSQQMRWMKSKKVLVSSRMVSPNAKKKINSNQTSFDQYNSIEPRQPKTANLTAKTSPLNHQPKQPRQGAQKDVGIRSKKYLIEVWPTEQPSVVKDNKERKTFEPQKKKLISNKSNKQFELLRNTPIIEEKQFKNKFSSWRYVFWFDSIMIIPFSSANQTIKNIKHQEKLVSGKKLVKKSSNKTSPSMSSSTLNKSKLRHIISRKKKYAAGISKNSNQGHEFQKENNYSPCALCIGFKTAKHSPKLSPKIKTTSGISVKLSTNNSKFRLTTETASKKIFDGKNQINLMQKKNVNRR